MDRELALILYHHWNDRVGVYMRLFDANYQDVALRRIYHQAAYQAADRANYYYSLTYSH